mgnify:CR=1 FL=1
MKNILLFFFLIPFLLYGESYFNSSNDNPYAYGLSVSSISNNNDQTQRFQSNDDYKNLEKNNRESYNSISK